MAATTGVQVLSYLRRKKYIFCIHMCRLCCRLDKLKVLGWDQYRPKFPTRPTQLLRVPLRSSCTADVTKSLRSGVLQAGGMQIVCTVADVDVSFSFLI